MKSIPVLLTAFFVACSGYGMYEDQIGKFDWHQEYLGKTKLAAFEQAAIGGGRRVFVATEKNVLAALNAKTGAIMWRKVFEDEPSSSIDFLGCGENLVTVSRNGLVRGWDQLTGALYWQFDIGTHSAGRGDWEVFALDESNNFYVFRSSFAEKAISARMYKPGDYAANALPTAEHFLPAKWMRDSTRCVVVGQVLSCFNAQEQSLALLDITGIKSDEPVEFTFPSLHSVESAGDFWTRLLQGGSTHVSPVNGLESQPYLLIQSQTGAAILGVRSGEELKLQILAKLPHALHVSGSLSDDTSYVVYLDGQGRVHAINLSTGAVQAGFEVKLPVEANRGKILLTHSQVSVRKETSSFACRLLLTMEDHSSLMYQVPGSAGLLWTREESLASISAVEMIDLPMSFREVSVEKEFMDGGGPFHMFVQRLTTQWNQLQAVGMAVLGFVEHEIGLVPDEKPTLERDEFNLHKLIVVATKPGKIFGMETLNGTIIWSSFYPHLTPFSKELGSFKHIPEDIPKFDEGKILLFLQRTTSHYPHLPLMSIVGVNKHTGNGLRISINPISGEVISSSPDVDDLGFRPAVVSMTHQTAEDHLHPLVFLGKDARVDCYPSTAVKTLYQLKHRLYFYVADYKTGLIRGYGLEPSTEQELRAEEVWQLQIPVEDQSLVTVKGKSIWEKVHSPGRVMGDRSVLYKYLNPNLFAVVGEGYDPNNKYFVNIYLIDGVTGQLVTTANHKRAKGPVHLEHSENWVVYSYFNEKYKRMEVATVSLYEGGVEREGNELSSLFPPPNPLMVEKQSFILPAGSVGAMRTTVTEKGITSRHVLLGVPSGHVVEMPWAWLDPMRPMQAAHMMRVEDLPPYVPELALPMEARVNYNRTLYRVNDIYTAPSGLESTCLMLAYGLDLYSTRVTPSKTFDVLKDDFDHVFICLVLAGLTAASYITKHLAARKALAHAWR